MLSWSCHLIKLSSLGNHWEAVVIGGCVAKNVIIVPTFSTLLKQVTGELMTSLW